VTVGGLCALTGMSKQNYYKGERARSRRRVEEELIVDLVKAERKVQGRLGARKLLVVLAGELAEAGVEIGRDRLLALLRDNNLLIEPRRTGPPRTTDSRHWMRVWSNLFKDAKLTGPHQAWVSDLTYLRTRQGFVYLALVMDAWSRKIVGWHVGPTLEALGCLEAARMALGQLPAEARPIHHSDRGTQYCCGDYVDLLQDAGLTISMTEVNHCYENARAERLNGILKQEYGLGGELIGPAYAERAVAEAVELYNRRRPHMALGYRTPQMVHAEAERAAA